MFPLHPLSVSVTTLAASPLTGILIKVTLVLLLTALVCKLLGRQSAAVRHRVWVAGLAASLVVPAASLLLPPLAFPVLPSVRDIVDGTTNSTTPSATPELSSPIALERARSFVPQPLSATSKELPGEAELLPPAVPDSDDSRTAGAGLAGVAPMLGLCWLAGTVIGSLVLLIAFVRQSARLSGLKAIEDDEWQQAVAAAAEELRFDRPIVSLESPEPAVPAVTGVLKPRLVVPRDWRSWSSAQRHCILLHELAHIQRGDVLTQLLGRCALLLYWFHPLAWFAVRRLRVERELAADDCVLRAGHPASDYAQQLLQTLQSCRPVRPVVGVAMAHTARLDQRVRAILDPRRRRDAVGLRGAITLALACLLLGGLLGGVTLSPRAAQADPPAQPDPQAQPGAPDETPDAPAEAPGPAADADPFWTSKYAIEYPATLPVSVAFSDDGKTLLTGDTSGEVMALVFTRDEARWRWKQKVGGSHAAVAFSDDQQKIYATTADGVRILDTQGKLQELIEAEGSDPTVIGVFPDKTIAENVTRSQIAFGTSRGYFVKSWVQGSLPKSVGTIATSIVAEGAEPADWRAVPLAVAPKGRSAIMTGPIDATGAVTGAKGKNVLWAYVCGDHGEGSPGNRVMVGHEAPVVSAAWAGQGGTAVTGDTTGRVILWDANTMKEERRVELGGRVAALALSNDGRHVAAYVLGPQGKVFVWEAAQPGDKMKAIHSERSDFAGTQVFASLAFSPDGKRLAGCALNRVWLTRLGELVGKVRVWELSDAPQAQLPPKHLYTRKLPEGSPSHFVVYNDHTLLIPSPNGDALDFRAIRDGSILSRLRFGDFTIGGIQLSADRRWLAMEQHAPPPPPGTLVPPSREFKVGIWDLQSLKPQATIPACRRLLAVASDGKAVAVVRGEQIELWDTEKAELLKTAPFPHIRIDAAAFSPDGGTLAISDRNNLVVWQWQADRQQTTALGRTVGSLAYSPDGRFLAEGPTPRTDIRIRDAQTLEVVETLANRAGRSMSVPRMVYAQGGRVLIACDNITLVDEIPVPHRIHLWDTADGSLAHQVTTDAGLPTYLAVPSNDRHLVAILESDDGISLSVWRLDGEESDPSPPGPAPPATEASQD